MGMGATISLYFGVIWWSVLFGSEAYIPLIVWSVSPHIGFFRETCRVWSRRFWSS